MQLRYIFHYINGLTATTFWNADPNIKEAKNASSLQIQTYDGRLYTLSTKSKSDFYFRTNIVAKNLVSKSILKRMKDNVWLELEVNCKTGNRDMYFIEEEIGVI